MTLREDLESIDGLEELHAENKTAWVPHVRALADLLRRAGEMLEKMEWNCACSGPGCRACEGVALLGEIRRALG